MRRRPPLPTPEAGIYQLAGTMDGQECWIAYDDEGECWLERGEGAYGRLEMWLSSHGVKLDSSRPALFLA